MMSDSLSEPDACLDLDFCLGAIAPNKNAGWEREGTRPHPSPLAYIQIMCSKFRERDLPMANPAR
jgi:hypothetical protein